MRNHTLPRVLLINFQCKCDMSVLEPVFTPLFILKQDCSEGGDVCLLAGGGNLPSTWHWAKVTQMVIFGLGSVNSHPAPRFRQELPQTVSPSIA